MTGAGVAGFIAWSLWAAATLLFHVRWKSAAGKRRWHPWLIAVNVCLLGGCLWLIGMPEEAWLIVGPMLGVAGWAMWKNVCFCDACGTTLYRQFVLGRMNYCPTCGARLH